MVNKLDNCFGQRQVIQVCVHKSYKAKSHSHPGLCELTKVTLNGDLLLEARKKMKSNEVSEEQLLAMETNTAKGKEAEA